MSETLPRAQRIVLFGFGVGFLAVAAALGYWLLSAGLPDTPWFGRMLVGTLLAVLVPTLFGVLCCALAVSGDRGFR